MNIIQCYVCDHLFESIPNRIVQCPNCNHHIIIEININENIIKEDPPIIDQYGTQEWYKNGKRHRDNDLPAIITSDGSQGWYKNGIRVK